VSWWEHSDDDAACGHAHGAFQFRASDSEAVGCAATRDGRFELSGLRDILVTLESFHGKQEVRWPVDPYQFLVWWHCGYPPSEERCGRGYESLKSEVGITPAQLLSATSSRLSAALVAGGMMPQLRATRLQEIARRVRDEFAGDLRAALEGTERRRVLKSFPGIGVPGAERILLFAHIAPIAAVPSNCPHVPLRIAAGRVPATYTATYAQAQEIVGKSLPRTFAALTRAYLLLQQHGRVLCKRESPKCNICPVAKSCAYRRRRVRSRK
jgi:endonuclease III